MSRVSGKGAPNTYAGGYALGDDSRLTIGAVASTRMFSFKEPEALKEQEFFNYFSEVSGYGFASPKRLELYAGYGKDGTPARRPIQRRLYQV